jgi:hypothetical protein
MAKGMRNKLATKRRQDLLVTAQQQPSPTGSAVLPPLPADVRRILASALAAALMAAYKAKYRPDQQ